MTRALNVDDEIPPQSTNSPTDMDGVPSRCALTPRSSAMASAAGGLATLGTAIALILCIVCS
jgi:hypothetical protein